MNTHIFIKVYFQKLNEYMVVTIMWVNKAFVCSLMKERLHNRNQTLIIILAFDVKSVFSLVIGINHK